MIFYTHWFIPSRFAAITYGPFIFIRPSKQEDIGLREHEKIHVKQFWKNPLFGFAYYFSKSARFAYEVEAYKEQLKYNPERINSFALALATKYNLGITQEQALQALKG